MKLMYIPAGKFTMGSSKEEVERCLKLYAAVDDKFSTEVILPSEMIWWAAFVGDFEPAGVTPQRASFLRKRPSAGIVPLGVV